jgi:hypothetical protein
MRCYKVIAVNKDKTVATRLASTNADARAVRENLMEDFDLRKKDVEIEAHEVPVAKPELLSYINDLLAASDVTLEDADE